MASIRRRRTRSGTISLAVLWRTVDDEQTSLTFPAPAGETAVQFRAREELVDGFRKRLELDGIDAARAWLAKQGRAEPSAEWTVDRWMGHYTDHLTSVTDGTRAEYRRMYKRTYGREFVAGHRLGAMGVNQVGRDEAALATNALAKRLSQKSVLNAKGLMFEAFAQAADRADIPVASNPFHKVKLPKAGDDGEAVAQHFLTYEQFDQLDVEIPTFWRPLVRTLVSTGMRWGEATALPVGEVKPGDGRHGPYLRVVRSWKHGEKGRVLGSPKTKKSRRTITLADEHYEQLLPLLEGRPRDALVFTNTKGDAVLSWNFHDNVWQPAIRRLQRCPAHRQEKDPCMARHDDRQPSCETAWTFTPRIHDLRHTHVAWLILEGVPLPVIQQRVGHESITTTVDTYGHLVPDVQIQAQAAASSSFRSMRALEARRTEQGEEGDDVVDGEVVDEHGVLVQFSS